LYKFSFSEQAHQASNKSTVFLRRKISPMVISVKEITPGLSVLSTFIQAPSSLAGTNYRSGSNPLDRKTTFPALFLSRLAIASSLSGS
jgi:hypothetical protein